MTEAERSLLFAMRNLVDALLLSSEPQERPSCPHVEREPAPDATLGHPSWRCARCHQPVEA